MQMIWRVLYVLELLLLAVPVTCLALLGVVYALGRWSDPDGPSNFIILFLAFVGLAGFWVLSAFYVGAGRSGLIKAHQIAWVASGVGVVATALGLAFPYLGISIAFPGLAYGIVGVPLLIPLGHLLAIRFVKSDQSNSIGS